MVTLGKRVAQAHVPPRSGGAIPVQKGQKLKVIDVQGQQVCDFFAFKQADPLEYIAPSYTRSAVRKLTLDVGMHLYSNRRNPLLLVLEDTVGKHDFLVSACDATRYLENGQPGHANCRDNTLGALGKFGIRPPVFPDPFNLFQNTNWDLEGRIATSEPNSKPGGYILFEALADLVAAVSACPADLTPTNAYNPTDIMLEVYEG